MRILLVEDEKRMAGFIVRGLKETHYAVDLAESGERALWMAQTHPYDLMVLDVMLPDKNGMDLCRELREKKIQFPILMLTARGNVKDKVQGLQSGADDYLVKPFAFEEFLVRIQALLRRTQRDKKALLCAADLTVNPLTHEVTRSGKRIELSSKEYALLEYLMRHQNIVVTRTMISEHVWNEHFDTLTNVIDVYVNYVRNKVDKGFAKPLIQTVRGSGYILKG